MNWLASRLPNSFQEFQHSGNVPPAVDEHLHAVRALECRSDIPVEVEVWRYGFSLPTNQQLEDVHVRFDTAEHPPESQGKHWEGIFQCAPNRHVDVLLWTAANAIVVAAANALYIVDPDNPGEFSGFAAPIEITGFTLDESARYLFAADSLRIYAFSSDRRLRWISEPLDGYGARLRSCGGRVLAVELKQAEPGPDGEEGAYSVIRLRKEDGTILRSRFSRGRRYWLGTTAA